MASHKRTETVVAEILNNNAIPCVFSGPGLCALFWARHNYLGLAIRTIDFVVPDHMVKKAVDSLLQAEVSFTAFRTCQDPSSCWPTTNQKGKRLQPSAHLHADVLAQGDYDRVVQIFPQSSLMWLLPAMGKKLLPPTPSDHGDFIKALPPQYTLASDACLPNVPEDTTWVPLGKFGVDEYPVMVPKAHVLLELRFYAYARYLNERFTDEAFQSIYLLIGAVEEGDLEIDLELLTPPIREAVDKYLAADYHRRDWDSSLMCALGYPQRDDSKIGDGPHPQSNNMCLSQHAPSVAG